MDPRMFDDVGTVIGIVAAVLAVICLLSGIAIGHWLF